MENNKKIRKECDLLNLFNPLDILIKILNQFDLIDLWKLRKLNKSFKDIFDKYIEFSDKLCFIGINNSILTQPQYVHSFIMDNEFKKQRYNIFSLNDNENKYFHLDYSHLEKTLIKNYPNNMIPSISVFIAKNTNLKNTKILIYSNENKDINEVSLSFNGIEDNLITHHIYLKYITQNINSFLIKDMFFILGRKKSIEQLYFRIKLKCNRLKCAILNSSNIIMFLGGIVDINHENEIPTKLTKTIECYKKDENKPSFIIRNQLPYPCGGFGFIQLLITKYDEKYEKTEQIISNKKKKIIFKLIIIGGWIQYSSSHRKRIEPSNKVFIIYVFNDVTFKYVYLNNIPNCIINPNLVIDKSNNIYVCGGLNPFDLLQGRKRNIENIYYLKINYSDITNSKWYTLPNKCDTCLSFDILSPIMINNDKFFFDLHVKNKIKDSEFIINTLKNFLDINVKPPSYIMTNSDYDIKFIYNDNLLNNQIYTKDIKKILNHNLSIFVDFLKHNTKSIVLNFTSVNTARIFNTFLNDGCSQNIRIYVKRINYNNITNFYCDNFVKFYLLFKDRGYIDKYSFFLIKTKRMHSFGYDIDTKIEGIGKNTKLIITKNLELYQNIINVRNIIFERHYKEKVLLHKILNN